MTKKAQTEERWFVFERKRKDGTPDGWSVKYAAANDRWREKRLPRDRVKDEHMARRVGVIVVRELRAKEAEQAAAPPSGAMTFGDFAKLWWTNELAKTYPDHVRTKKSADDDKARLERYVLPHVGKVPMDVFSVADAECVMSQLPAKLSSATRRQVAQAIHRLLKLAAYPARIIERNPLPAGFLPRVTSRKALTYLYPSEDAALLAHEAAPLCLRVFYGFAAREGLRESEALSMAWRDLDLEQGAVVLDKNKTDDPRLWALDPGVREAMKLWKQHFRKDAKPEDRVFVDDDGAPLNAFGLPEALRQWLKQAGVTRAALYEKSDVRQPLRVHDLRATFVTVNLANDKTEAWISDRTGHKSSVMINRYRRAARSVSELGLGKLEPMDRAIPELAKLAAESGRNGSTNVADTLRSQRGQCGKAYKSPVPKGRVELPTRGFSVRCSTN